MPIIKTLLKNSLRKLRNDLGPQFFNWKSIDVRCVANDMSDRTELIDGGVIDRDLLTIYVDREEFYSVDDTMTSIDGAPWTADSNLPPMVSGVIFRYMGREFLVNTVRYAPGGSHLVIDAVASNTPYQE